MKSKITVAALLLVATLVAFLALQQSGPIENGHAFPKQLSSLKLFKGPLKDMHPEEGIEILELASTLFTDYSEKQRLLQLPEGKKMLAEHDGLPQFPEGTLLAKTFYYAHERLPEEDRKIIETRILLYEDSKWNVATYKWNEAQTEAFLLQSGTTVQQEIITEKGERKSIAYKIPSNRDCATCHRSGADLMPIGPKMRNLNMSLLKNGKPINQLAHLQDHGLLELKHHPTALPSYAHNDTPIEKRARAYLDLNCAHCHHPAGFASSYSLNLLYETSLPQTGIKMQQVNMLQRMQIEGALHMPKLGTTIVHEEGIQLLQDYIETLQVQEP